MPSRFTHCEYNFLLHTCNFGDAVRIGTGPFTGEVIEFPLDEGLAQEEIDALQCVFDKNGIGGPEADNEGYAVYGDRGDYLRFRCSDLDRDEAISNIAVEIVIRQLADPILVVILDVARAGNFALMSSTGDNVRIIGRIPTQKILTRWSDAKMLSSVPELRLWLQDTIGGRQVRIAL